MKKFVPVFLGLCVVSLLVLPVVGCGGGGAPVTEETANEDLSADEDLAADGDDTGAAADNP